MLHAYTCMASNVHDTPTERRLMGQGGKSKLILSYVVPVDPGRRLRAATHAKPWNR
jgi:hypothetical protein